MVLKSIFSKKDPNSKSENQEPMQQPQEENKPAQQTEPPAAVHLENAMIENARADSQESRAKVYQELLFSDLLLALADSNTPPSETPAQAPNNINVAIMSNQQGVPFAAAFTSAQAARRWRAENGQYIAIRGQDIFKLLEPSPAEVIVINPASAPFIVLNKVDYRQLAVGIIPQSQRSPVQAAAQATGEQQQGMQIAFPPDAFNEEQKQHTKNILFSNSLITAAAIGAILPQNTEGNTNWLRTIFLRIQDLEENQEAVQKFCLDVRNSIMENNSHFEQTHFEVGVMSDPQFWAAMHQNNFILFDKQPPQIKVENLH